MESYQFLFWAYNVIWLGLAGYLLFMMMRIRKTEARLARLEQSAEKD